MPFIVGCPRSGTTLLRLMLDSSPLLAIPPETGFLAPIAALPDDNNWRREQLFEAVTAFPPEAPVWPDFQLTRESLWNSLEEIEPFNLADGVRAFYRLYAARFGKPHWGEKTPTYGLHLRAIKKLLPEARFVHLIRDGRDVALSLREQWFAPSKEIDKLADYWVHFIAATRQQVDGRQDYLEIRYEDLIQEPRRTLDAICKFLELPYTDAMERYHERAAERLLEHGSRVRQDGREVLSLETRQRQQRATKQPLDRQRVYSWKTRMTGEELWRFESRAAHVLHELGYEVTNETVVTCGLDCR